MNVYWKIKVIIPDSYLVINRQYLRSSVSPAIVGSLLDINANNALIFLRGSKQVLCIEIIFLLTGWLLDEIGCLLFWSISWRDFFLASLNQFWGITNKLNMIPQPSRTIMESTSSTLPPPDNADLIPVFLLSRLGSRYFKIKQIQNKPYRGVSSQDWSWAEQAEYTIRYSVRFMQKKSLR